MPSVHFVSILKTETEANIIVLLMNLIPIYSIKNTSIFFGFSLVRTDFGLHDKRFYVYQISDEK